MEYISTRGGDHPVGFKEAVMTGLARDGGLFLPRRIPDVRAALPAWRQLAYNELAFEIMRLYVDCPAADLRQLIGASTAAFQHPEITPVVSLNNLHILELFHGPTLAFKDLALQFLGRFFEYELARTGGRLNILAATSGDTGSAAIHGAKGRQGMRIIVLYPHERISPIQELQMTTVPDENVFALALQGDFDDCQSIVKRLFQDLAFRDRWALGAMNSINWARLLSQIVYYFYAAFRVIERTNKTRVRFAVPTGNFGNILAGYLAWRMGLPIGRLILASNDNDILTRFFNSGVYRRGQLQATLSPSMDIQVASNFERYLYYLADQEPGQVKEWMSQFSATGELRVGSRTAPWSDPLFAAASVNQAACLATIRQLHSAHGYLLDPHSAIGVSAAQAFWDPDEPMICLATAHPAKFSQAIQLALGQDLAQHATLEELKSQPIRRTVLPACDQAVRAFVEQHAL